MSYSTVRKVNVRIYGNYITGLWNKCQEPSLFLNKCKIQNIFQGKHLGHKLQAEMDVRLQLFLASSLLLRRYSFQGSGWNPH